MSRQNRGVNAYIARHHQQSTLITRMDKGEITKALNSLKQDVSRWLTDVDSGGARLTLLVGCLNRLLSIDRFLDSRGQSRRFSAWWRSLFKEKGFIQSRQLRAIEFFI